MCHRRTLVSSATFSVVKKKTTKKAPKTNPPNQYIGISINRIIIRKTHNRTFTLHFAVRPQLGYSLWAGASHLNRKQPPFSPLENKKNDLQNIL